MRAVVQRVRRASVEVHAQTIHAQTIGEIGPGLLVYLGAARDDSDADVQYMARKIAGLRVFSKEGDGKMTASLLDRERPDDASGEVLVISQFTLFGDVRRGLRPSFDGAAPPEAAEAHYEALVQALRSMKLCVATGRFRADMLVRSEVAGPVTIQIDTRKLY